MAKENPFWFDWAWVLVFSPSRHPVHDALTVLEALSLILPFGTREKDRPASKVGPQQSLPEHRRSFAAYVLDYHDLWQTISGADDSEGGGYVPTRSLYDSLPEEAQAELRRRADGATSHGFLECMTWPSMCRVVYRTASGSTGIGSRITRPGDLVCRVPGSKVLMTLRPIVDRDADPDTISCLCRADRSPGPHENEQRGIRPKVSPFSDFVGLCWYMTEGWVIAVAICCVKEMGEHHSP